MWFIIRALSISWCSVMPGFCRERKAKQGAFPAPTLLFTSCRHFNDKLDREVRQILIRSWPRRSFQPAARPGSQASGPPSPGRHGEKQALVPQGVRAPFCVRSISRWLPPAPPAPRDPVLPHSLQLLQFRGTARMRIPSLFTFSLLCVGMRTSRRDRPRVRSSKPAP